MGTLKKVLAVAAVAVLWAGLAQAGTIESLDRFPPQKEESTGEVTRQQLDCSNAIMVDVSSGLWIDNNTNVGAPNNVEYYNCSGWWQPGGEVVYRVTFPDDVTWSVSLSDMSCDLDLFLLASCDENDCLFAADWGMYTTGPAPGEYYFVVDGYYGAACSYTITFETVAYLPPDFCDLVIETPETCEEPMPFNATYSGNTCDGPNLLYDFPCLPGWTYHGLEHYYKVCMQPGSSFTVDLYHTADGAIWIFDNCTEPWTCLAGADDSYSPGGMETITYTHTGSEQCFVYLVIDSWGGGSCGDYTFDFHSSDGAVATQVQTFSGVKSLFR